METSQQDLAQCQTGALVKKFMKPCEVKSNNDATFDVKFCL